MADGLFSALVRRVSASGTYHFTALQLYAVWCGRKRPGSPWVFFAVVLTFFGYALMRGTFPGKLERLHATFHDTPALAVISGISVLALLWGVKRLLSVRTKRPSLKTFRDQLESWARAEELPHYIDAPSLGNAPPSFNSEAMAQFGAGRILIVDDDLLVDFFVRNGAHAEHRMLVVSHTGYPGFMVPLVNEVMAKQPNIPVFLLHGTGARGQAMAEIATQHGIVHKGHELVDLGWTLAEAKRIKRVDAAVVAAWDEDVPIDLLHPKALLGALAASMQSKTSLAQLLQGSGGADIADSHFG